jgi:hypothetical protein
MKSKTKSPKKAARREAKQETVQTGNRCEAEPNIERTRELLRRLKESGSWMEPPAPKVTPHIEPEDVVRIRESLTVGEDLHRAVADKLPALLKLHRTLGQAIRQLAASDTTNTRALTALIENSVADVKVLETIPLNRLRNFSREMLVFPHLLRIKASGGSIPKNRVSDLQLGDSVKYARELSNAKQDEFTKKAHDYLWALHDHAFPKATLDNWEDVAVDLREIAAGDDDLPALTEKVRTNRDEGSEAKNRSRAKETIVERAGSLLGRHKSPAIRDMHVKKRVSRS